MVNVFGLFVTLGFLVGLPSVFIALAVSKPKRRYLFWTIACLLYPIYLALPFLEFLSPEYEPKRVLEGIHGVAMLTSGPGGYAVSEFCGGFKGNFPYDNDWSYFIILLMVMLLQMICLWFLGMRLLRNKDKPLGKRGFVLIAVIAGMAVTGLVHGFVFMLHHC
jgi:hypothetical protein